MQLRYRTEMARNTFLDTKKFSRVMISLLRQRFLCRIIKRFIKIFGNKANYLYIAIVMVASKTNMQVKKKTESFHSIIV